VILVSLPSHCTHTLQPLDISFFKSLNTFYDAEIQSWLRHHPGRVVTEFQIAELFSAAYRKAATYRMEQVDSERQVYIYLAEICLLTTSSCAHRW